MPIIKTHSVIEVLHKCSGKLSTENRKKVGASGQQTLFNLQDSQNGGEQTLLTPANSIKLCIKCSVPSFTFYTQTYQHI